MLSARIASLRARALEWERRGAVHEAEDLLAATAEVVSLGGAAVAGTVAEAERARSLLALGQFAHRRGDVPAALARYVAAHDASDDRRAALAIEARIAFARYDLGQHAEAGAALRELVPRALAVDEPGVAGVALGYLGNVARARGLHRAAARCWSRAHAELRRAGDRLFAAAFAMDEAIASLLRGEDRAASQRLETAARDAEARAHWYLPSLVGHYQVLARLRAEPVPDVTLDGPETDLARFLHDVRALGAALTRAPRADHGEAVAALAARAPSVEHARASVAWLRARLDDARVPGPSLRVHDEGRVVEWAERVIDLSKLGASRRLLLALVDANRAGAGPLSLDALVGAGWPGERLVPSAARNRVHVALSSLRSAGLRAAIERIEAGYRLDPTIRVVVRGTGGARR